MFCLNLLHQVVPPLYEEVQPLCMKAAEEDARHILALPCRGSGRAKLAASKGKKTKELLLQTKACNCFAGMAVCKQVVVLYS